jgi:predicted phage tail component-like protein
MGFIYNGLTSQNMGIKARLENWQASPSLRNSFVTIPGKPGVADFGSDITEKTITLKCNVYPKYRFAELVAVLDNLAEWLDPEKGVKQLVLDDVPDRYFTARLQDAVDCERLILAAGAFDLKFVCPDPFAYTLSDETYTLTAEGTDTVTRAKGNTDSLPVYSLKAIIPQGSGTYVQIQTNDDILKVVGPLAEVEMLIIDSGLVTAKVVDGTGGTLRNGLPLLQELNFPVLRKGANVVAISTVGAPTHFTELQIQAKSRWR